MRFARTRGTVFAIVLASYVLSFFHRTAPAAIADELTSAFEIHGAVLGTLAAAGSEEPDDLAFRGEVDLRR
jgi:hypothetical protein